MTEKISLETLLESGAHFGHQKKRWNPKIKPYIYGLEDNVHIFDLTKTKTALETALDVLTKFAKEDKTILFIGTKKQAKNVTKDIAEKTGSFYINERWLGGTLTNFEQMKKTLESLDNMLRDKEEGKYSKYTKKERLLIDRKMERIKRFFGGLIGIKSLPDLLVIIDIKKESGAIYEARNKGIPTIGIVDTNSDPDAVDYPIPMNDDATKAIEYVLGIMADTILAAKSKRPKEKVSKEN